MNRAPNASPRPAFTLVELLVVIGIIALLISILLPALNTARQSANQTYCLSNERQIGTLINLYANQFNGSLPLGVWRSRTIDGNKILTSPGAGGVTYFGTLMRGMLGESDFTAGSNVDGQDATIFNDVDLNVIDGNNREQGILRYSTHPRLMPDHNLRDPAPFDLNGVKVPRVPYKLSQVRDGSEKIMLFDGTQQLDDLSGNAQADGYNLDYNRINYDYYLLETLFNNPAVTLPADVTLGSSIDGGANVDFSSSTASDLRAPGNIRWRHRNNAVANALFADGHAEGKKYRSRNDTDIVRRNVAVLPNR